MRVIHGNVMVILYFDILLYSKTIDNFISKSWEPGAVFKGFYQLRFNIKYQVSSTALHAIDVHCTVIKQHKKIYLNFELSSLRKKSNCYILFVCDILRAKCVINTFLIIFRKSTKSTISIVHLFHTRRKCEQ